MIDDLQEKFLPAFITSARTRVADARGVLDRHDPGALLVVIRQLHCLCGEAGLLGLRQLMLLARDAEETATRAHSTSSPDDANAAVAALNELAHAIELVGKPPEDHRDNE